MGIWCCLITLIYNHNIHMQYSTNKIHAAHTHTYICICHTTQHMQCITKNPHNTYICIYIYAVQHKKTSIQHNNAIQHKQLYIQYNTHRIYMPYWIGWLCVEKLVCPVCSGCVTKQSLKPGSLVGDFMSLATTVLAGQWHQIPFPEPQVVHV